MSHTPGQWEYIPNQFNVNDDNGDHSGSIVSGGDRWWIAAIENVDTAETTLANANLIAAAPDLLAACEATLAHLAQSAEFDRLSPEDQLQAQVSLNQKLQAAVKKAKGEL